jgi:hypothetical protein
MQFHLSSNIKKGGHYNVGTQKKIGMFVDRLDVIRNISSAPCFRSN